MADQNKAPPAGGKLDDIYKDAGKSEDEARRTSEVDSLDRDTDALFEDRKKTNRSPVFTALWKGIDMRRFDARVGEPNQAARECIAKVIEITKRHRDATPPTIYGPDDKLSDALISELAAAGFGGLRIPEKFGGKGADLRTVMDGVRAIGSQGDLTVAGTINVHGLIGVVSPLLDAGKEDQQAKFLPKLASWEEQSAFALTERGAGSDLTNIKTRASWKDGKLVVNGHKIFISNSYYGRRVALVCMIEEPNEQGVMQDNKALFIVKLPDSDTENFQLETYGLHPLRHMHNHGLIFKDFELDPANRIQRIDKNGKPVANSIGLAYEALNRGRTAVAAMAAAGGRVILQTIAPNGWAAYRETYGTKIEERQGVKGAIANIAMTICGLDAMVDWCASLLDNGWRGELECIVAKNFGANSITDMAIFDGMRLHGGRAMLHGNFIGDNMMEFLVNRIYEGAHDMLGMALALASIREHIDRFMMPLGDAMKFLTKGDKNAKGAFGKHVVGRAKGLFGLGWNGTRLGTWYVGMCFRTLFDRAGFHPKLKGPFAKQFQKYINFADEQFLDLAMTYNGLMVKNQLKLIDKQLLLQRLAERQENLVLMTRFASAGAVEQDVPTRLGLSLMCRKMHFKLTGQEVDEKYDADRIKLANFVIEGKFKQLDGVMRHEIMFQYK